MPKSALRWLMIVAVITGFNTSGRAEFHILGKRRICPVARHATARMAKETDLLARCSRRHLPT